MHLLSARSNAARGALLAVLCAAGCGEQAAPSSAAAPSASWLVDALELRSQSPHPLRIVLSGPRERAEEVNRLDKVLVRSLGDPWLHW